MGSDGTAARERKAERDIHTSGAWLLTRVHTCRPAQAAVSSSQRRAVRSPTGTVF